ncbi:unnamed protein product [Clonostachys byssicola]|uniref:BZIP domain-containing protein n=1 Tax=Clonostachys byssicola TaxID=160290 RepID=A0A9N9Y1X7_9HYPO|nr:unnamed protein product [Clonostachys byssicola]
MEATQEADSIRERKERKKVQNRLNQRARRSRLKEDKTDKKADRPYEVDRWRVHYSNGEATEKKQQQQQLVVRKARPDDEPPRARLRAAAAPIFGPFVDPVDVSVCICSARAAIIKSYSASVSADQLLELIQFNVFRALVANKYSMTGKAQHYQEAAAEDGAPLVPYLEQTYPGNAVLVPLSEGGLPVSLLPTQLQITVRHATWIDLLPFPRMRDNLIRAQHQFDHAELVNDVIGQLIDLSRFFRPEGHLLDKGSSGGGGSPEALEDEATTPPRGGFIVYGAPHRVESWEVTPEFVWKWGWTLMGCQELMESTNRWRRSRGEAALPMIITRPWHNNSLGLTGVSA